MLLVNKTHLLITKINVYIMNRIFYLLVFIPILLLGQELSPPEISLESGFYPSEIEVSISSLNPDLIILYTLDGSEPRIENLIGKEWEYKTEYPISPGDDFGEIKKDTIWTYQYVSPLTLHDRSQEETILADISTSVFQNNGYYEGEFFKGNILRARVYNENDDTYSDIVSKNYFITEEVESRYSIPVVSISLDNGDLYGYEEGIGVPGITFDNWRIENPTTPVDGFTPANYRLKGSSTEKRIHFNYFENGMQVLNHDAGIRLNGGYTRSYPNKSFRLYAKNEYGEKNFKHDFFNDYEIEKFKRLILRNSGNDASQSFFRDAFIHEMSKNLNFDIQESQPVVLFINGEYNGLRNLRERYDKKYFESIHNVLEDDLDFLENHVEIKEGDQDFYNEMIDFFENYTLEEDAIYNEAITYIDPVNFTDYYVTYIYAANDDWPGNNYLFWRHKTSYNPNENEGTKDGRFRWLLKDMDRGFHLNDRYENGYEANTLEWATQENNATLIIRKLLENEGYRYYFINRFADLLNTTFKEDRVASIISMFETVYAPEMEENARRWQGYASMPYTWQTDVNRMKTFAWNRPNFQREHLMEKFDLSEVFDLVLNVSNTNHGHIHLNTIDIHPNTDGIEQSAYPWIGKYFDSIPVTVKAVPYDGYEFSHWSGLSNSNDPELEIVLNDDSYLKAHFIPESLSTNTPELLEATIYPNPTDNIIQIQGINDLEHFLIYDSQGRVVKSGGIKNDTVKLEELKSGVYFIYLETKNGEKISRQIIKN